MGECQTIKCPTCGSQLDESFVEQRCPRCQTIIESKFICGSCHSCADSISSEENKSRDYNPLKKIFSIFTVKP